MATTRYAPKNCPVCGSGLALTRLSCESCGTELSGTFHACEYCALGADDREILRVFLSSRGNMKELERHLGVSYPTARARLDGLLHRLGLEQQGHESAAPDHDVHLDVLESLARGDIDVDEALQKLDDQA